MPVKGFVDFPHVGGAIDNHRTVVLRRDLFGKCWRHRRSEIADNLFQNIFNRHQFVDEFLQHEEIEAVEPEASAEQVDPRDEKVANLEAQLAEAQTRERDGILRVKAEMENLRRRTELDIEKAHKFALEKFINELLPVIDSLDRALEVADKANPDMSAMVEGIELTLKSMLDVVRKFGVEVIAETNVPLDPNVHQAIAMVESDDVAPGNVLGIMQKGYTLNGRTIRAAMVTVAKAKA